MLKRFWIELKKIYYKIRYHKLKELTTMCRAERRRLLKRAAKSLLFSMPDRHELTRAQARGISYDKAKRIMAKQVRFANWLWSK